MATKSFISAQDLACTYYNRLLDAGLPEVYAAMAAKNFEKERKSLRQSWPSLPRGNASNLVDFGFEWSASSEGFEFWEAIWEDSRVSL